MRIALAGRYAVFMSHTFKYVKRGVTVVLVTPLFVRLALEDRSKPVSVCGVRPSRDADFTAVGNVIGADIGTI